jgi:hypothetical protein
MNGALVGIAAAVVLALGLGFLVGRGRQMNLEQWTVAGRAFGAPLVFLLMAGEIYTTFTFLGGSGFAYGKGGAAYYILCYGALAYVPILCCRRSGAMGTKIGCSRNQTSSSTSTAAPCSVSSSSWSESQR